MSVSRFLGLLVFLSVGVCVCVCVRMHVWKEIKGARKTDQCRPDDVRAVKMAPWMTMDEGNEWKKLSRTDTAVRARTLSSGVTDLGISVVFQASKPARTLLYHDQSPLQKLEALRTKESLRHLHH